MRKKNTHCDFCFFFWLFYQLARICCQQILRNHRVFFFVCARLAALRFDAVKRFLEVQADGTHMAAWSIVNYHDLEGCVLGAFFFLNVVLHIKFGCFLKWWYPRNTTK